MDNRWLVTLNSDEARDQLLNHGLHLFNKKIKLRRYDDVLNDEYVEYQHYEQLQQKLFAGRQEMDAGTADGIVEDDDELSDQADCWEQQDNSTLRVTDRHKGPPTTAVNTPEPPHNAF